MTTEGFYEIRFSGQAGFGFGQIILDTGRIVGADVGGGKYDGTYKYDVQTRSFDVDIELSVPPDAWLVQGVPAQGREWKLPIKVKLPRDLGGEQPLQVQTPAGPVNVVIRKLRDFPF